MTDRFPDVTALLLDLLEAFAGEGRVNTETPDDLQQVLPFVRVRRISGPSDRVNDYAQVDVDVYHSTYAAGEPLAQQILQYLTGQKLRGDLAVVDRVQCNVAPIERPHPTPGVRWFHAEYLLVSRRHALP